MESTDNDVVGINGHDDGNKHDSDTDKVESK